MKALMISFLFCCMAIYSVDAQIPNVTKAIPKSFDVKGLTGSIMSVLGPKLKLTDKQSSGVTNAVSSFLGKKSEILPLQATDPSGYKSKFGGLYSGLKSNLGGILAKDQMNKFVGLKPKTNDASNVLSNLFY